MRIMHGVAEAMELNHSQEMQHLLLHNQKLEAVSWGRRHSQPGDALGTSCWLEWE